MFHFGSEAACAPDPMDRTETTGSPLRVLHATPSFGLGGREIRIVELMNLGGAEFSHQLVALDGDTSARERVVPGTELEILSAPGGGGPFGRWKAIRAFLRVRKPDVVATYNWGSIEWVVAAGSLGLPVVHHEDGFGPEEVIARLRRRSMFRKFAFRWADRVLAPSKVLIGIAETEWGLGAPKLLYVPNGVDLERFAPVNRDSDGPVRIGCVGRLRPEKNQVLAIEAMAQCSHRGRLHLRLVGDGPDREALEERVAELGLGEKVTFVGAVDDTAPEYRELDVFLIPSKTEQMPISLLEAMATSLPVVGADVGDVRAMLASENADDRFVVTPDDVSALAAAIDRVAADENLRKRLGRANRENCERRFEREACYLAYLDAYRAVVEQKR